MLGGDPSAFEGVVQRWQGPLVNLAYRFCRDRGRAEEMAQDALLRVFRFLDRWDGDCAFSTWMFAVALNVYRSQARRFRPEIPLEQTPEPVDGGNPEEDATRTERAEVVQRAVTHLPGKYRDALLLFYFNEMDVTATAGCLGVPEGTVKARLHRGRALLRRKLDSLKRPGRRAEAT